MRRSIQAQHGCNHIEKTELDLLQALFALLWKRAIAISVVFRFLLFTTFNPTGIQRLFQPDDRLKFIDGLGDVQYLDRACFPDYEVCSARSGFALAQVPTLLTQFQVFRSFLRCHFANKPGVFRVAKDHYTLTPSYGIQVVVDKLNWQHFLAHHHRIIMHMQLLQSDLVSRDCLNCAEIFTNSGRSIAGAW
jgi:hypothetical protein